MPKIFVEKLFLSSTADRFYVVKKLRDVFSEITDTREKEIVFDFDIPS